MPSEYTIKFVLNAATGKRYATLGGKKYLAVATVMLTEGVHKGSRGPILYHRKQLRKNPHVWNMKPVVVYHPKTVNDEGEEEDALATEDEAMLDEIQVGFVMNTRWDEKARKLRAEVWLDEEKLDKVDKRVLKLLNNNKSVEVSTGLGLEYKKKKGKFKGVPFTKIAYNYAPEHLAILPDQEGACNRRKGAGLLVTNSGEKTDGKMDPTDGEHSPITESLIHFVSNEVKRIGGTFVNNELSHSSTSRGLMDALAARFGEKGKSWYGYLCEVYNDWCVYCTSYNDNRKMYAIDYAVKDDMVNLTGDPVEVKLVSDYKTVTGTKLTTNGSVVSQLEEEDADPMADKTKFNAPKHIDALITNGIYDEDDREHLEDMDIDDLKRIKVPAKLVKNSSEDDDEDEKPRKKVLKKKVRKEEDEELPQGKSTLTFNQLKKMADPKARAILKRMESSYEQEVETLVEKIVNNERNVYEEEYLKELDIDMLRGMAALIPDEEEEEGDSDYTDGGRRMFKQGAFVGNSGGTMTRKKKGKPAKKGRKGDEVDDSPLVSPADDYFEDSDDGDDDDDDSDD